MNTQCSQKLADSVQAPIKKVCPFTTKQYPNADVLFLHKCGFTISPTTHTGTQWQNQKCCNECRLQQGTSVGEKDCIWNTMTNLTTLDTMRLSCNKPGFCIYYFLSHSYATFGNTMNCTHTETRIPTPGNCLVMKYLSICKCQQQITRPLLCSQPACLPAVRWQTYPFNGLLVLGSYLDDAGRKHASSTTSTCSFL